MTSTKISEQVEQLKQQDNKRKLINEQIRISKTATHDKCSITIANQGTQGSQETLNDSFEVNNDLWLQYLRHEYILSVRVSENLALELAKELSRESTNVHFASLGEDTLRLKPEAFDIDYSNSAKLKHTEHQVQTKEGNLHEL